MAKKLIVNCGTCDARSTREETLQAYETIMLNCGEVLVTPETAALLNRYHVTMNCGNVRELEKDVKLQSINGKAQIRSTDTVGDKIFLQVNGTLEIGPGTREVLGQYVGIQVNGKLLCPESMSSALGKISVNGRTVIYPDEAVVLGRNACIDRTFVLRAKERLYWSENRIIITGLDVDVARLAAKGAHFSAEEIIVAESLVEPLIDLIDEKARIVIVPDGVSVVAGDLTFDELTMKQYGKKLYVLGTLDVEQGEALAELEYLNLRSDAKVLPRFKGLLMEKAVEIAGRIAAKKGCCFRDKIALRISKKMLEDTPDGVEVQDCVTVRLDADIPDELIQERLSLRDCVSVHCKPEQEGAVSMVSEDVVSIHTGKEEDSDSGIGHTVKAALGLAKDMLGAKVVNAGDYIL